MASNSINHDIMSDKPKYYTVSKNVSLKFGESNLNQFLKFLH